jgi:phosphoribosyl 1,2-cyclic phosphodiesterase
LKIKFWGTRGSVPAAGPDTVKYGGNTTCLEIRLEDGELIVLDAGTGIRKLGVKLLDELAQRPAGQNYSAHLIFTHFHWDHIQGFPFFRPVFSDRFSFRIYGRLEKTSDVRQTLADQIRAPYLPFLFEHLRANLDFVPTGREPFTIGRTKIHSIATNHPNNAIGYKIIEGGKTFVFLTDNELYMDKKVTPYEDFVGFCAGADLLVHDAQWDDEEAKKFPAWGHSSYSQVVELAVKAKVKCVGFTHHDPYHPDSWIDRMVAQTQNLIKRNKMRIRCFAAREGLTRKL